MSVKNEIEAIEQLIIMLEARLKQLRSSQSGTDLNAPIDVILRRLDYRQSAALVRNGYKTVGELIHDIETDAIYKCRNVGAKTVARYKHILRKEGYTVNDVPREYVD